MRMSDADPATTEQMEDRLRTIRCPRLRIGAIRYGESVVKIVVFFFLTQPPRFPRRPRAERGGFT